RARHPDRASLLEEPLAENIGSWVRACDDVAAVTHVHEVEGSVDDAHTLGGGRRIECCGISSFREPLHGVEVGAAESGCPGCELRACGGAEADRSHQTRVCKERFHAVRRK